MRIQLIFYWFLVAILCQSSIINDSMPSKSTPAELGNNYSAFFTSNNSERVLSTSLSCPVGQYTKIDGSACENCDSSCASCVDFTKKCLVCIDSYTKEIDSSDNTKCKCKGDQSGTTICACDANKWFDGSNCKDCITKKNFAGSNVEIKIKKTSCCKDQEYFETGKGCKPCKENCIACKDGDGSCLKCNTLSKFSQKIVRLKKTSCCAIEHQYYKNGSCQECNSSCSACEDISGDCITCKKNIKGKITLDIKPCCPAKSYWKLDMSSKACTACPDTNCEECQNVTGNCLNCSKNVKMKAVDKIKQQPSCCANDNEYYSSGNGCKTCPAFCSICKDGSSTCLKCTDEKIMDFKNKPVRLKKKSCCPDDKYWSTNNKCEICPGGYCLSCKDVSGDCISCEKKVRGSVQKFVLKTLAALANTIKSNPNNANLAQTPTVTYVKVIQGIVWNAKKV